jgi:hypothetical protein
MARNISTSSREEILASQSDKVFLLMLKISSDELTTPLYFVQNNEDIVSNGNTYKAIEFSANIPTEDNGKVQDSSISISGITRQVTEAIRSIVNAPDVEMFLVRADIPDIVEGGPWYFKLRSISYDVNTITGSLRYETALNRNLSTIKVTNQTFPAVYD